MGISVDESSSGDLNTYEIEFGGEVVGTIGLDGKSLYLGTNTGVVEDASQKNGALADDNRFKNVWSNFSNDMTPALYVDLSGAIDMLENLSGEDLGFLSPIDNLAIASSALKGAIVPSSMLLVITP